MAYIQNQSKHLGSVSFPSLGRSDTVADIPAKVHKEIGERMTVIDDPDQTVICLPDCKKHLGGNIALFVLDTQAFFDYEVQKICSITASMATLAFNKSFMSQWSWSDLLVDIDPRDVSEKAELLRAYDKAVEKGAMFDSRCFNIPESEVCNYFYWRQLDASRNSIQMVGQANFSHKELHGKSCNMIQDMLHEEKGINWNDFPTYLKRGSCCRKIVKPTDMGGRSEWIIDTEIPEFVGEGREYIEGLLP